MTRPRLRQSQSVDAALHHPHLASHLSDGEFSLYLGEILLPEGGPSPAGLEAFKDFLAEDPSRRRMLMEQLTTQRILDRTQAAAKRNNPQECWMMGTDMVLTPDLWRERMSRVAIRDGARSAPTPFEQRTFHHSGEYVVSAIASLWKGARYLETFLENITSQSIFDKSELIIIDANSPDGEAELIRKYQSVYPNIVYHRVNYRIGIYDAWNEAIRLAKGRYLTNTNLDDLRRIDSFALQAQALDDHPAVDIVYQDFFYALEYLPDFETVAQLGLKSDLPLVTGNNLLCYNSPHNAPMWRASLHQDLGLFDATFRSAGDYEFWLRCVLHQKTFYKLNTPHVVYYQNPEGVSTSPDTPGIVEARRLRHKYARKLISSYLLMSRQDFLKSLDGDGRWKPGRPAYDVVQDALIRLGSQN